MQSAPSESSRRYRVLIATLGIAVLATSLLPFADAAPAAAAGTLDRIRQAGKIELGYRADARPFSYKDESGKAAGYSIALCEKIADDVKAELALPALTVEWVPVTLEDRFQAVQQGKVDLLCGADTATLTRRKDVSFSIPIFPSGIGAILRADSPAQLREVLAGRPSSGPIWRGSPARILEKKTFSVVGRTTSESWLGDQLDKFKISATVAPVDSYQAGIQRVLDRSSDVFFGDRPILYDAAEGSSSAGDLVVLDRLFTYEPLALALGRGDEDFRLVVDRSLSRLFKSSGFKDVYVKWFGEPDDSAAIFFGLSALPE
jgi:polar amino acid transport system substrate-binding protein